MASEKTEATAFTQNKMKLFHNTRTLLAGARPAALTCAAAARVGRAITRGWVCGLLPRHEGPIKRLSAARKKRKNDWFSKDPIRIGAMEQTKETIDELRQKIGALELKRNEAEQAALEGNVTLQETKRYLTRLIESSPDAVISTNQEGNIVLFSESAESLLGYRAKEVTGQNISVLYGDEAGPRQIAREMRKRGGSVSNFESVLLAKDGSNIPVLISASVLSDDKGEETGTIGFVRDSRERKREEEEREELATELKAGRDRFQYLLTVTPGVIYTTQASGDYACKSVSENLDAVMGFSPWEMIEEPGFWVSRLHPDDAP